MEERRPQDVTPCNQLEKERAVFISSSSLLHPEDGGSTLT